MSALVWDDLGQHLYETGVEKGVLYVSATTGEGSSAVTDPYGLGVAWNGLTGVTEKPSGAEATDLWADDIKYLSLMAAEKFDCTIEAYTYPDEFAACDGSANLISGVRIGQQDRKPFGLCYKTILGNDTDGNAHGYKLHLIYGCKASPSEKSYSTINDSPEAITFSWEVNTTPVNVSYNNVDYKATSYLEIDSTKVDSTKLTALEAILYGSQNAAPRMPLPADVVAALA